MIKTINHVAISTPDIARILHFYQNLIGMELVGEGPFGGALYDKILGLENATGRVAMLRLGDTQLELFEFSCPTPKPSKTTRPVCDHGITHLCFEVDDIDAEYDRLSTAGISFHCPPQDAGFAKASYGRDPDGNVFELLELVKNSA